MRNSRTFDSLNPTDNGHLKRYLAVSLPSLLYMTGRMRGLQRRFKVLQHDLILRPETPLSSTYLISGLNR